jgi:hypothetical protein
VPWCDDCAKFWNPNSMPPDGTCPSCGRVIGETPDTRIPWHFWVLVSALVLYLGWRLVQGVQWLVEGGAAWAAALLVLTVVGTVVAGVATYLGRRRHTADSTPPGPP